MTTPKLTEIIWKNGTHAHRDLIDLPPAEHRIALSNIFSEAGLYGLPAGVYSFVLILWEVTSLKISFGRMVAYDAVSPYVTKKRPKIKRRWPGEVKRLIKDGLHEDPSRRPNMPTVCNEISSYLKSNRVENMQHGRYMSWQTTIAEQQACSKDGTSFCDSTPWQSGRNSSQVQSYASSDGMRCYRWPNEVINQRFILP